MTSLHSFPFPICSFSPPNILHIQPLYRASLFSKIQPEYIYKAPRNNPPIYLFLPLLYNDRINSPSFAIFTVGSSVSCCYFSSCHLLFIMPLTFWSDNLCCLDSAKCCRTSVGYFQKCTTLGGSDMHGVAFLKSKSDIGSEYHLMIGNSCAAHDHVWLLGWPFGVE